MPAVPVTWTNTKNRILQRQQHKAEHHITVQKKCILNRACDRIVFSEHKFLQLFAKSFVFVNFFAEIIVELFTFNSVSTLALTIFCGPFSPLLLCPSPPCANLLIILDVRTVNFMMRLGPLYEIVHSTTLGWVICQAWFWVNMILSKSLFYSDRQEWCSFHKIPGFLCSRCVKRLFYR